MDHIRNKELLSIDEAIYKELEAFIGKLRVDLKKAHPTVSTEYIQEVIDITLEEALGWTWTLTEKVV